MNGANCWPTISLLRVGGPGAFVLRAVAWHRQDRERLRAGATVVEAQRDRARWLGSNGWMVCERRRRDVGFAGWNYPSHDRLASALPGSSSASCLRTGSAFDGPTCVARELFALVDERRSDVSSFLEWARAVEHRAIESHRPDWSLRLANRPDIVLRLLSRQRSSPSNGGASSFSPRSDRGSAPRLRPRISITPAACWRRRARCSTSTFPRGSDLYHRITTCCQGGEESTRRRVRGSRALYASALARG